MNKQELMARYTKLAIKTRYNLNDFEIYFDPYLIENEEDWIYGKNNIQTEKSITYNGTIYSETDLYLGAWNTIIHEITHIKILGHDKVFWEEYYRNWELLDDLRKEFNKEVGWDEDFIYNYEDDEEPKDDYDIYLEAFEK